MPPIFSMDHISYAYSDNQPGVIDISMEIKQGEQVVILGANASGKSTLLRLLDGLIFSTSGTVNAFGQSLSERSMDGTPFGRFFRQQVAFLFQNTDAQLFCSSVEEELAFGPRHLGMPESETARRTQDMIEMFRLGQIRHRPPQMLSGGEKKRVGLAAILAVGPSVILLDEPTAGLDPRNRAFLVDTLLDLSEAGKTVIVATHDLSLAKSISRRAVVLGEDHEIAADGPVEDILSDLDLLASVNLVHVHQHRHGQIIHAHQHHHAGPHEHDHDGGHK